MFFCIYHFKNRMSNKKNENKVRYIYNSCKIKVTKRGHFVYEIRNENTCILDTGPAKES